MAAADAAAASVAANVAVCFRYILGNYRNCNKRRSSRVNVGRCCHTVSVRAFKYIT